MPRESQAVPCRTQCPGLGIKAPLVTRVSFVPLLTLYSQFVRPELPINTPSHPSRSLTPRVDWLLAETCRSNALEGLRAYRLGRFFHIEPWDQLESIGYTAPCPVLARPLIKMGGMGSIFRRELPPPIKSPHTADEGCLSTRTGTRQGNIMDTGIKADRLPQTIAEAFSELGLPELPCRSTTLLIQDGYCVGRRFVFDGVQAVWLTGENVVHFYDENGRVSKSVGVGALEHRKSA